MATTTMSSTPSAGETVAERDVRVEREAHIISNAHAEIDAGLGIEDADMNVWLDRLDQDGGAPLPAPRGAKLRI